MGGTCLCQLRQSLMPVVIAAQWRRDAEPCAAVLPSHVFPGRRVVVNTPAIGVVDFLLFALGQFREALNEPLFTLIDARHLPPWPLMSTRKD